MRQADRAPLRVYTIGIAALFLIAFFLFVVMGAQIYRRTVGMQSDNDEARALLSYLSTCAKGSDENGGVYYEEGAEGPMLIVPEGDSGYERRIYRAGSLLVEDFAEAGAALMPEDALPIGKTDIFTIEEAAEGLLRIRTDKGEVLLAMRTAEVQP